MATIQRPEGALPYLMKKVLERLRNYETLTCGEAHEVLLGIAGGLVNESQATAFMAALMMRPVSIDELSGFRDALMEKAVRIKLTAGEAIDIVGTGGDGKSTFNISTLSAFVVAGCGHKVIKHGNYGATSVNGSSDVLEYLGYSFTADEASLNRQLERAGICFLHAPLFHPAMKKVAHIRRDLGVRTFFNLLGPLINPAFPPYLLLGANTSETARMFHYLLQDTPLQYKVVHTIDGYDELSLTAQCRIYSRNNDQLLSPEALGFAAIPPVCLNAGKDLKSAAAIFLDVLQGKATTEQQQVVMVNSAMALHCLNETLPFEDCLATAAESLQSGSAYQSFQQLIQAN
jgi:anthranilate phosphoribosyltransferase